MNIWQDDRLVWNEYCATFFGQNPNIIRDGCQPVRLEHEAGGERAIILIHGLSDSPWFLHDLAEFFHFELGYDVYLPLLAGHGLREPGNSMEKVTLGQWKKNIEFAIDFVFRRKKIRPLSIGGLSMGGAFSYYYGCTHDAINGDLFLFSAAFGLRDGFLAIEGRVKEFLLRTPVIRLWRESRDLIGENPYRYEYVSINSVKELVKLMVEIRKLNRSFSGEILFPRRVFSAFSEFDNVVSLKALENFFLVVGKKQLTDYRIHATEQVAHASLVLKKPIRGADSGILERENPLFGRMVEKIAAMAGL
jgi:esterase/lipase